MKTSSMKPKTVTSLLPVQSLPRDRNVSQSATRIMDYLAEYPKARDTLRGIAEWWTRTSMKATVAAIDRLLDANFLLRSERGEQTLYSRNPIFSPAQMDHLVSELSSED
jgi:hypothetical protein